MALWFAGIPKYGAEPSARSAGYTIAPGPLLIWKSGVGLPAGCASDAVLVTISSVFTLASLTSTVVTPKPPRITHFGSGCQARPKRGSKSFQSVAYGLSPFVWIYAPLHPPAGHVKPT